MSHASQGVHGPRIKLLSDLHRPLEEHWAGTNKKGKGKGLDAIGSDYLYKHHITQLEEIYKTKNQDPLMGLGVDPLAIDNKNISPQAQLYGIEGLLSPHLQPGYEAWKSKREGGWDPYLKVELPPVMLEKVSALAEKRVPPPPKTLQASPQTRKRETHAGQPRPASASPVRAPASAPPSPSPSAYRIAQSPGPGQPSPAPSAAGLHRGANSQSSPGFAQHQHHQHHQHQHQQHQHQHQQQQHYSQPSPTQQQHASRGAPPGRRPASAAAAGRRTERDPPPSASLDRPEHRPEHRLRRSDGAEPRPRLHRCNDPRTPAEQLILAGQYRLSAAQHRVYAAFVEMLLGFDRHDQHLVLTDCLTECREQAMLSGYCGAGL